jgi:hypothetical protein
VVQATHHQQVHHKEMMVALETLNLLEIIILAVAVAELDQ